MPKESNENGGGADSRRTTIGFSPDVWAAIDAHQLQLRAEHGNWVSSAGTITSLVKAGLRSKGLLPEADDDTTEAEAATA